MAMAMSDLNNFNKLTNEIYNSPQLDFLWMLNSEVRSNNDYIGVDNNELLADAVKKFNNILIIYYCGKVTDQLIPATAGIKLGVISLSW